MMWGYGQNVQGINFLSNTMLHEERKESQHEIYGTQKSEDNRKGRFGAEILESILCSKTPCSFITYGK